jgi:hypothetical protein
MSWIEWVFGTIVALWLLWNLVDFFKGSDLSLTDPEAKFHTHYVLTHYYDGGRDTCWRTQGASSYEHSPRQLPGYMQNAVKDATYGVDPQSYYPDAMIVSTVIREEENGHIKVTDSVVRYSTLGRLKNGTLADNIKGDGTFKPSAKTAKAFMAAFNGFEEWRERR